MATFKVQAWVIVLTLIGSHVQNIAHGLSLFGYGLGDIFGTSVDSNALSTTQPKDEYSLDVVRVPQYFLSLCYNE